MLFPQYGAVLDFLCFSFESYAGPSVAGRFGIAMETSSGFPHRVVPAISACNNPGIGPSSCQRVVDRIQRRQGFCSVNTVCVDAAVCSDRGIHGDSQGMEK